MTTVALPTYRTLSDNLLQSVLGKEAPNECIVQGQNISEIGQLSDNYSSLRRLDISFNALKSLKGIEQFPRLRDLSAYCCRLDDVFHVSETTHLQSLLLQQNGITSFPSSFRGLKNLRELRVDRNQLSTIENLNCCVSLRILDISFNSIESLSGLAGLQSLQELRANNNIIKSLITLKSLPSIREVQVSHNKLTTLEGIQQLPTLEIIHADHNLIKTVRIPQTFTKKKSLSKIDININNNTTKAPLKRTNSNVGSMSSRSTGVNNKEKEGSVVVLGLLALTELNLSNNEITSLEGINSLGIKMEILNVSYNSIDLTGDKIDNFITILSSLKSLNELQIERSGYDDSIVDINALLFKSCPNLKSIDGQLVTGERKIGDISENEENYEKNIHYDSSDSDEENDTYNEEGDKDKDKFSSAASSITKRQSFSKRRVSISGSKTAIKEIAQIDDVLFLEGQFKKVLTNCRDTWTTFLKLTEGTGTSSELPTPVKYSKRPEKNVILKNENENEIQDDIILDAIGKLNLNIAENIIENITEKSPEKSLIKIDNSNDENDELFTATAAPPTISSDNGRESFIFISQREDSDILDPGSASIINRRKKSVTLPLPPPTPSDISMSNNIGQLRY